MADIPMDNTQNSAPGQSSVHEVSKFSSASRRQDTQSVTKRYGHGSAWHSIIAVNMSCNMALTLLQSPNRADAINALQHSWYLGISLFP